MNRRRWILILVFLSICVFLAGCQENRSAQNTAPAEITAQTVTGNGEPFAENEKDKDFSKLRTPGSQEEAYEYSIFFRPELDGINQPYVGDTMPYYENGTWYIYYLKEGGDSYNHSIYLATTKDFVTYTEYDAPILESSRSGGQDGWAGTGSVVKVKDTYYFFYTGHASSETYEYMEKIMVAKGNAPDRIEKVEGWEITPPAELGQKRDFRDPQAYYDEENDIIRMTVTASQDGRARILGFTLSGDLQNVSYDGIIFTNTAEENFWNLECSDTFRIGEKYYLTYSAQDDTLWYAVSDTPYGPYGEAKRLDGKLFYAAKHVENPDGAYMAGWVRRSESPSSTSEVSGWAGNLAVQKLKQKENGDLALVPVDAVEAQFNKRRRLAIEEDRAEIRAGARYSYTDVFNAYESFMLKGKLSYSGKGSFGLAFDYNGQDSKTKIICLNPSEQKLQLLFNEGDTLIAETAVELEAGKVYNFTYIQEGSAGIFWLGDEASLTVRLYGVSGKAIRLFAESNTVTFSEMREYTR